MCIGDIEFAQQLYLDVFYRDVAGFVLGFVAVHIEICLSDAERLAAFDVFFDRSTVPAVKSVAALASILSATKAPLSSNPHAAGDAAVTIGHCLRLLERVISDGGLGDIVETLLTVEVGRQDDILMRRFVGYRLTNM